MREADIRPLDLLNEYLRLSAADVAEFFPDLGGFEYRPCPGCGAHSTTHAFAKDIFKLVRCRGCGTLFVDPAPPPALLASFYRDSRSQRYWGDVFFPAVAEARREKIFAPRVTRIAQLMADHGVGPGAVMDVGAGTGIFLEECRRAGWAGPFLAVEPSANLAERCRQLGFETFEGLSFEAAATPERQGTADLVTAFEVIEHVHDVAAFISDLARLAKPGGWVLVTGLCGTGFDILTLGAMSKAVSPPHHLNFLSRHGVEALMERCGLELMGFHTPGQLDLDIVKNTLAEAGQSAADLFIRHLIEDASPQTQAAFQTFLAENGLSSHLWILARRPA